MLKFIRSNTGLSLLSVLVTVLIAIGGTYLFWATIIAIWVVGELVNNLNVRRNKDIRLNAHKLLDHEMGGLRYLGSEVSLLATQRLDLPSEPGPLRFEQLCKTNRGTMFKLCFETADGSGRARGIEIFPISAEDAESWLERERIAQMHKQGTLELA